MVSLTRRVLVNLPRPQLITLTRPRVINLTVFCNQLIDELIAFAKQTEGAVKAVIPFGNFFPERVSGTQIMENIKAGRGNGSISSFVTKIIIRNELEKI